MRIIAVLLCLASLNGYAQEQEFELKLLLIEEGVVVAGVTDFEAPSSARLICENGSTEESYEFLSPIDDVSPIFFGLEQEGDFRNNEMYCRKALVVETYAAGVVFSGGYAFHVADYNDGTRVVTCLDGGMKGYQGIWVNGVQAGESANVTWYNTYFLHRYPAGKIYSYPNKQVIKIK